MLTSRDLRSRARRAGRLLEKCRLCPRSCGADRLRGKRGFCGAGAVPRIAAASIHHGEEPPLSGSRGSGNIFFSHCTMACLFCQNYPVSRLGVGREVSVPDLARTMLDLQERGVHNINLVSPTPWVPQILEALSLAVAGGLFVPLVCNSGGYESPETLRLLDGVIDIWLPDMKYASPAAAWRFSRAPGYVAVNRRAVLEMARQAGGLRTDAAGVALGGVIVRHLLLPGCGGETAGVLAWLDRELPCVARSLMYQYFPAHRAVGHPLLGRRPWREECAAAEKLLRRSRTASGWVQDYG